MKIVVTGAAGLMGPLIVRDLSESSEVEEVLVADYQESKAKQYAASFKDPRIKACFVDVRNIEETAKALAGYDAVINSVHLAFNMSVMKACLKAGCHYNDLGGMLHITRKQLELHDDFRKAGLTAVLGIGSAPGITNVMARYAYDRLDEVQAVHMSAAQLYRLDIENDIFVFRPPYSVRSIMDEFSVEPVQFIDGEYKSLPPLSGTEEIVYPEPIGQRTVIYTLHSEPATIPASFKDKGVREVTWKLGLPPEFHDRFQFLASIGFASDEPVKVSGAEVSPLEVLTAVLDKHVKEKLEGVEFKRNDMGVRRAQVLGKKGNRKMEYVVDCIAGTHSRWGATCATQAPPSIVAQMQVKGMIKEPGVWAPEQVIEPEYFFKELAKREMRVQVTIKEDIA